MINFKIKHSVLFGVTALLLVLAGCQKYDDLPNFPEIEFEEYTIHKDHRGNDTSLTLTISFRHGHGEMGLSREDTVPPFHRDDTNPYQYNFFIEYYEKIEGEYQQVRRQTGPFPDPNAPFINFHSTFPVITPSGKNKAIQGKLKRHLSDLTPIHSDTIRFRTWILDRNLEKSNKVWSPEIRYKP